MGPVSADLVTENDQLRRAALEAKMETTTLRAELSMLRGQLQARERRLSQLSGVASDGAVEDRAVLEAEATKLRQLVATRDRTIENQGEELERRSQTVAALTLQLRDATTQSEQGQLDRASLLRITRELDAMTTRALSAERALRAAEQHPRALVPPPVARHGAATSAVADLRRVRGIGPAFASALSEHGVESARALSLVEPTAVPTLAEALGTQPGRIARLIEAARALVEAHTDLDDP